MSGALAAASAPGSMFPSPCTPLVPCERSTPPSLSLARVLTSANPQGPKGQLPGRLVKTQSLSIVGAGWRSPERPSEAARAVRLRSPRGPPSELPRPNHLRAFNCCDRCCLRRWPRKRKTQCEYYIVAKIHFIAGWGGGGKQRRRATRVRRAFRNDRLGLYDPIL